MMKADTNYEYKNYGFPAGELNKVSKNCFSNILWKTII